MYFQVSTKNVYKQNDIVMKPNTIYIHFYFLLFKVLFSSELYVRGRESQVHKCTLLLFWDTQKQESCGLILC